MKVNLQKLGNSRAVVIPKPLLAQAGLDETTGVDMTLEGQSIVLRKPPSPAREGWSEAAAQLAASDDDALVMGDFSNEADAELKW